MIEGVGRMQPVTPALGEAQTPSKTPHGTAPGKAAAVPEAVADLSVSRIAAEMAAAPPVDAGKVAMLREAIASGAYLPDPRAIAEAMIRQAEAGA